MTKEKPPSDPSLDEILASIRQMISNEPVSHGEEKPSFASRPYEEKEEILDLTNLLPDDSSQTQRNKEVFQKAAKNKEVEFPVSDKRFEDLFVSPKVASETAETLGSLTRFAEGRRRIPEPHTPLIENELREILTPLLKEWLDNHLPSIVRWVVNEQVEKIIKQGGVMASEQKPKKPKDYF
jgi:cell pole-organizing protein PopZ